MENMTEMTTDTAVLAPDEELAEAEVDKYLIFLSGGIYYGVDTKYVNQMLTQWDTAITWLPMLPPDIRGVMNLRGGVVPIIDFRLMMGCVPEEKFCTVILEIEGTQIGILVDEVDQTVDIQKNQILPVPHSRDMASQKMVTGMYSLPGGEKTLMVLDCTQLLYGHQ